METCDQGGCTARATREFIFDNGFTLWACGHDAAEWFPTLPADTRFDMDHQVIAT